MATTSFVPDPSLAQPLRVLVLHSLQSLHGRESMMAMRVGLVWKAVSAEARHYEALRQ